MFHFEIPQKETEDIQNLKSEKIKQPPISVEALKELCEGSEVLPGLLKEMLNKCLDYTITVARFKRIVLESEGEMTEMLREIDSVRKTVHDTTIDSINIFSRALAKERKDNSWMLEVMGDRAKYGRFALTLTLSQL